MSVIGVSEAASALGLSARRVRQMLADGSLAGERVGRAWIIDSEQLRRVENGRSAVGRPWNPASAWAVLALVDGEELKLSPVERSRAKKRLAQGLEVVAGRLAARAGQHWFYGHPSVLVRLAGASHVVRGGVSGAADHGGDLVVGEAFEGYVRLGDLDELVSQFGLEAHAARPNVLLRVVDDSAWPFVADQGVASRAVVAVDLFESLDQRSRRAGEEMMASNG